MVVHHTGKDAERGPRGHSSLFGAADTLIEISRPKDAAFSLARVIKQKDGPKGQEFAFHLRQVDIGIDEDGDPITSCVVVPTDEAVPLKGQKKLALPPSATIALKALQEAVAQCGESPPSSNHIPSSVNTVTKDLWRRYAYQMGISSSEEDRAKQAAFKRAAERLISLELVGQWGQTCWLCP
jgi:hypothetical protein